MPRDWYSGREYCLKEIPAYNGSTKSCSCSSCNPDGFKLPAGRSDRGSPNNDRGNSYRDGDRPGSEK